MPTEGQATFFHQNINSFIALTFVGSLALAMGLFMVNIAFGYNPVANLLMQQSSATAAALHY